MLRMHNFSLSPDHLAFVKILNVHNVMQFMSNAISRFTLSKTPGTSRPSLAKHVTEHDG